MNLRIVQPGEDGEARETTIANALNDLVRLCLTSNPLVVCLLWETAGGTLEMRAVPDAATVRRGIIEQAQDHLQAIAMECGE